MTQVEPNPELSPFVASMTTRILRHTNEYADEVAKTLASDGRAAEQTLLDSLNHHVETVVANYNPPGPRRRGDSLVFAHLYDAAKPHPTSENAESDAAEPEKPPVRQLAALIAAETEFRGPLRLSTSQNGLLAEVYERLGGALRLACLPSHAVLSYRRACALHHQNEDYDREDKCALALARVRQLTLPSARGRLTATLADILCGYGYRPFRMLIWIAVELFVFTGTSLLVKDDWHWDQVKTTTYMALTDFLNPLGLGDAQANGNAALFVVESYAGTVSASVFFALLVRQWFRL